MLSVDLARTTVPRAAPVSDENPISLKNINVYKKKNKTNLHKLYSSLLVGLPVVKNALKFL